MFRTGKEVREVATKELRKGICLMVSYKATSTATVYTDYPLKSTATVVPVDTTNYIKVVEDECIQLLINLLLNNNQVKLTLSCCYKCTEQQHSDRLEQNSVKLYWNM